MKTPNISLPIDRKLDRALRREVRRSKLKRSDVIRQILMKHFGLIESERKVA